MKRALLCAGVSAACVYVWIRWRNWSSWKGFLTDIALDITLFYLGWVLIAPFVGYWVGYIFFGWTGCSARSAGLALLGGGSLATKGLGMAGGKIVVATTTTAAKYGLLDE